MGFACVQPILHPSEIVELGAEPWNACDVPNVRIGKNHGNIRDEASALAWLIDPATAALTPLISQAYHSQAWE
jgi:hypothetical protein